MSAVTNQPIGSIRPMLDTDLRAIMRIERRAYPFPWTEGIFLDCLRVGYHCWVYLNEGDVAGYAVMSTGAGEAHVLNVCVSPDHQRRSIGSRLLEHMLRRAARLGAEEIFLEVRPTNRPALALYAAYGFGQVGVRRDYYPAHRGREDALILARTLSGYPSR